MLLKAIPQLRQSVVQLLVRRRMMSTDQFAIRRLKAAEEVATLTRKAGLEGWKPGALSYFAADRTGFFVGELNGKAIACMSAVKYSDTFAFLGYYIVEKNYRKMGYGRAIWETTIGSIPEGVIWGQTLLTTD